MGLTGIVILTVGFNYGLIYASASQGALVYALSPAATAAAAVLGLKESSRNAGSRALSCRWPVLGWWLPSGRRTAPLPAGVGALCMLAGILAWAYYTVIAKRFARADQLVVTAWVMLLGVAMLLLFAAVESLWNPHATALLGGVAGILFLGAAASALGLRHVQSGRAPDAGLRAPGSPPTRLLAW